MTIDALPSAPAANDSVDVFDAKAFAWVAALQQFASQANALGLEVQNNADITAALALGMALPNYGGTSTSSLTIGAGAKTLVTQAGKSWVPGQVVVVSNGAGAYMKGTVAAYAASTLDVNVTAVVGSGSFSSWTIGLSYTALGLQPRAQRIDVASVAGTVDLTAAAPDSDDIRITGSLAITAFTVAANRVFRVTAGGAFTLTNNASIVTQTGGSIAAQPGDTFMLRATAANVVEVLGYTPAKNVLRSYLAGLTLSTAGASTTMTIAAGQAADRTNAAMLYSAASISKTTGAWAVGSGNGGLDIGAIANSTWYHFYTIRRPDTGVVDVLFSLSATAPTLPTNYTQFRRIGSGRTNGSAQWTKFVQDGDYFRWDVSVFDVGLLNPGTASVAATLSVPTGVKVDANINILLSDSTNLGSAVYVSDLAASDEVPSISGAPLFSTSQIATTNVAVAANLRVRTNTSAQVRYRCNQTYASLALRIATIGWFDDRGRNS